MTTSDDKSSPSEVKEDSKVISLSAKKEVNLAASAGGNKLAAEKKPVKVPEKKPAYKKYMCLLCGFVYEEEKGWPEDGIKAGTRWDDIPDTWVCPDCGATKDDFEMIEL